MLGNYNDSFNNYPAMFFSIWPSLLTIQMYFLCYFRLLKLLILVTKLQIESNQIKVHDSALVIYHILFDRIYWVLREGRIYSSNFRCRETGWATFLNVRLSESSNDNWSITICIFNIIIQSSMLLHDLSQCYSTKSFALDRTLSPNFALKIIKSAIANYLIQLLIIQLN